MARPLATADGGEETKKGKRTERLKKSEKKNEKRNGKKEEKGRDKDRKWSKGFST